MNVCKYCLSFSLISDLPPYLHTYAANSEIKIDSSGLMKSKRVVGKVIRSLLTF